MADTTYSVPASPISLMGQLCISANDCLMNIGERIASNAIGQLLFRKAEGCLRSIEKTIQWSLPSDEFVDATCSFVLPETSVRPLPWVFFIPLLCIVRGIRACLCVVTWLLRSEPVQPIHMVSYIQRLRRRLRAIKFRGMYNTRRQLNDVAFKDVATSPGQTNGSPSTVVKKKRKFQEVEMQSFDDEVEPIDDILDRLALEHDNEETDPNYEPSYCSLDSEDSTSSVDDDADVDVAISELSVVNEVIDEDSENSSTLSNASLIDGDVVEVIKTSDQFHSPLASESDVFESVEKSGEISDRSLDSAMKKFSNLFSKKDKKAVHDNSI